MHLGTFGKFAGVVGMVASLNGCAAYRAVTEDIPSGCHAKENVSYNGFAGALRDQHALDSVALQSEVRLIQNDIMTWRNIGRYRVIDCQRPSDRKDSLEEVAYFRRVLTTMHGDPEGRSYKTPQELVISCERKREREREDARCRVRQNGRCVGDEGTWFLSSMIFSAVDTSLCRKIGIPTWR